MGVPSSCNSQLSTRVLIFTVLGELFPTARISLLVFPGEMVNSAWRGESVRDVCPSNNKSEKKKNRENLMNGLGNVILENGKNEGDGLAVVADSVVPAVLEKEIQLSLRLNRTLAACRKLGVSTNQGPVYKRR